MLCKELYDTTFCVIQSSLFQIVLPKDLYNMEISFRAINQMKLLHSCLLNDKVHLLFVTYLSILLNTNTVPFLVSISKSKYLVVLPVPLEKLTQLISSNLMCMGGLWTYMNPLSSGYRKPLLDLCEQLMVLAPPNLLKKNNNNNNFTKYFSYKEVQITTKAVTNTWLSITTLLLYYTSLNLSYGLTV